MFGFYSNNEAWWENKANSLCTLHGMFQVSTLETSIDPLQASLRDLTTEKEALVIERDSLKNEVDRWKSRANHLIEQANRTDPDEQKKIM